MVLLALFAVASPAVAEGEAPADLPDLASEWTLRMGLRMGGGYASYTETLSQLETENDSGAFEVRYEFEGNFAGLSPYLRCNFTLAGGDEEADLPNGSRQEQDLSWLTLLFDLGLGYRIPLGETVTLVPALGYTLDHMVFEREEFQIDGVGVTVLDLNGRPQSTIGEAISSNGLSARLGVEVRPVPRLDLRVYAVYTWLPDTRVDNDLGGTVSSEGQLVRGGFAVYVWLHRRVGFGGEVEVLLRDLDKSTVKIRSGSARTASIQFPNSESLAVVMTLGVVVGF